MELSIANITRRIPNVGAKAHGLVFWREGFLLLSSASGAVHYVSRGSGLVEQLWQVWQQWLHWQGLPGACALSQAADWACSYPRRHHRLARLGSVERRTIPPQPS